MTKKNNKNYTNHRVAGNLNFAVGDNRSFCPPSSGLCRLCTSHRTCSRYADPRYQLEIVVFGMKIFPKQ